MSHIYAVIMAGGVGSRFWPRSRERTPKQLIEILSSGTMIQNTVNRIQS
ncbi:MAG TPA: sugar phosphate nucleotidyltransferase, partial [Bacteroidota bacterium]|nr:sugar phosphate nucleotidyltransferase [Bacteroidota bacterium]